MAVIGVLFRLTHTCRPRADAEGPSVRRVDLHLGDPIDECRRVVDVWRWRRSRQAAETASNLNVGLKSENGNSKYYYS